MVPIEGSNPDALARWVNAHEVYCEPWSLWITVCSGRGLRLLMAMLKALVTSGVAWWLSIDQPTTRRENTSSTTQQYTLPSRAEQLGVGVGSERRGQPCGWRVSPTRPPNRTCP